MGDGGANHAFEFHSPGVCSSKLPEPDGESRAGREKVGFFKETLSKNPLALFLISQVSYQES